MSIKLADAVHQLDIFPGLRSVEGYFLGKEHSLDLQVIQTEDVLQVLKLKKKDYNYIRVASEMCKELLHYLPVQPENVRFLQIFDSLSYENGMWVPRLTYFDILRAIFVRKFKNHNIKDACVIICHEHEVLPFIQFCVGLGHQRIIIFNESGSLVQETEIKKHIIGIHLHVVSFADLTQVSELSSLMLNSLDLPKNSTLLNDLAYFNFMSRDGVVIDLCSNAPVNPFLFEAEKAGLRTLARKEIVSQFEFSTLLKLGLLTSFEKENFFQEYSEIMTID